jgi:hypothetical protein
MDLSDVSENIPSDTTGDRSGDLPTSRAALKGQILKHNLKVDRDHFHILLESPDAVQSETSAILLNKQANTNKKATVT